MAFVITLYLQASAVAALSCKLVQPVIRGGHGTTNSCRNSVTCCEVRKCRFASQLQLGNNQ